MDQRLLCGVLRGQAEHAPDQHLRAAPHRLSGNPDRQAVGVVGRLLATVARRAGAVQEPGLEGVPVIVGGRWIGGVRSGVVEQELRDRADAGVAPRHVVGLVEVHGLLSRSDDLVGIGRVGLVPVLGQVDRDLPVDAVGREDPVEPTLEAPEVGERNEIGDRRAVVGREQEEVGVVGEPRRVEQARVLGHERVRAPARRAAERGCRRSGEPPVARVHAVQRPHEHHRRHRVVEAGVVVVALAPVDLDCVDVTLRGRLADKNRVAAQRVTGHVERSHGGVDERAVEPR